jgi:hypothetical protein
MWKLQLPEHFSASEDYGLIVVECKITTIRIPRRRWEDNIKTDLREIGWVDMCWINLAQDRDYRQVLMNTVMNPGVL